MLDQAKHYSFSRLKVLSDCRMKYNYMYIDKKVPLEPIPDYFGIGKIVDHALEHKDSNTGYDNLLLEEKISFLDEKWYYFCKGIWDGRKQLYDHIYGDRKVLLQMPVNVFILNKETGEVISDSEGLPIPFTGLLDGYESDEIVIDEIKTTGGSIEQIFQEHVFTGQTQIYAYSVMQELKLEQVPKIRYTYIQKPRIKQKKNETIEEFYQRIYEVGLNPEITPKEIQYTPEELEETMLYYFNRINNDLKAVPTCDRSACMKFGNKCQYFGYCWKHQHDFKSEETGE